MALTYLICRSGWRKGKEHMPEYIGVTMQKGGVGKTLIAEELAAALAKKRKVLLVDLDPAGHTTKGLLWSAELERRAREERGLPIPRELDQLIAIDQEEVELAQQEEREPEFQTLYTLEGFNLFQALIPEALPPTKKGKPRPAITPQQLIRVLPGEEFDLLPAHEEMTALQGWLSNASNRIERLWNFLAQVDEDYIVIMDSPPDLGPITDSVLYTSRSSDSHNSARPGSAGIIVPMEADDESLNALDQLWAQIDTLERVTKIHIDILTVLPNKYEDGVLSTEIMRALRANLPEEVVAPFEIRKRNVVRKAYHAGQSIYTYWPSGPKERHLQKDVLDLRKWFDQLADLVLARLEALARNEQVSA
jgi:cellulose biosynthesis protein BcsQ